MGYLFVVDFVLGVGIVTGTTLHCYIGSIATVSSTCLKEALTKLSPEQASMVKTFLDKKVTPNSTPQLITVKYLDAN